MAERLEDVERPRRRRFYPWEEWTDGATWSARQGVDFTCSPMNFQVALHQRARLEHKTVETGSPEKGIVEFRFTKKAEQAPPVVPETLDPDTGRDDKDDWLEADE
jgi:hypothetical protein